MKISKQSFVNQCYEIRKAIDFYAREMDAAINNLADTNADMVLCGVDLAMQNFLAIPMETLYASATDSWNTLDYFHDTFLGLIMNCHVHHIIGIRDNESYEYMMDFANDLADTDCRVEKYASCLHCDADFYDLIEKYESGKIEDEGIKIVAS